MAIPWLVVLKAVPWKEVISNAPKVADGAKKLWSSIGKKAPVAAAGASAQRDEAAADAADPAAHSATELANQLAKLRTRLASVETATTHLHEQLLASAELIKTLADQNSELIKRIESNRARTVWLTLFALVIAGIAVAALLFAPLR